MCVCRCVSVCVEGVRAEETTSISCTLPRCYNLPQVL